VLLLGAAAIAFQMRLMRRRRSGDPKTAIALSNPYRSAVPAASDPARREQAVGKRRAPWHIRLCTASGTTRTVAIGSRLGVPTKDEVVSTLEKYRNDNEDAAELLRSGRAAATLFRDDSGAWRAAWSRESSSAAED
jgi:hypothetical protein